MLLQTRNLCKKFVRGGEEIHPVADLNLELDEVGFMLITGKSGSGKTTLLAMLAGLLAPTAGKIFFDGTDIHSLSERELALLRNRELGFVPQDAGLLGNFTVFDNVRMPQVFSGSDVTSSDRAAFLLELVGLARLGRAYPAELSGGELRRVSIARALFNNPRLLLADEPTSSLDLENSRHIIRLLADINALGTALIIVTHDKDADLLCRPRPAKRREPDFTSGEARHGATRSSEDADRLCRSRPAKRREPDFTSGEARHGAERSSEDRLCRSRPAKRMRMEGGRLALERGVDPA
jgi:putative ABC transport system ATP-binding protein